MAIGVAVADSPTGPFRDAIGKPLYDNGAWDNIDPTVLIDDDGQAYLYWGNPNVYVARLGEDMVSITGGVTMMEQTVEGFGAPQADKRMKDAQYKDCYTEGPWITKRGGKYMLLYAAGGVPEHIAYSMSDTPVGPWKYMGPIMPLEDTKSFTNHCGVADYKGRSYFFYHTGKLPGGGGFGRSAAGGVPVQCRRHVPPHPPHGQGRGPRGQAQPLPAGGGRDHRLLAWREVGTECQGRRVHHGDSRR